MIGSPQGGASFARTLSLQDLGLLLVILVAMALGPQTAAQEPPPKLSPTLVVDLSSLSDKARASLANAIGNLEKQNSPELGKIRVKPGDSWYGLINKHYGFYDSGWPQTAKTYASIVASNNGVDVNAPLMPDQELRLPALPTRPSTHANSTQVQIMSTNAGGLANSTSEQASSVLTAEVFPTSNLTTPSTASKSSSATTLVVQLLPGEDQQLMQMLATDGVADEVRSVAYLGPLKDKTAVEFPKTVTRTGAAVAAPPPLPNLAALNLQSSKKIYILDFMDETVSSNCPHGKQVREVALEVLDKSGASGLAGNVEAIEVDFYRHKEAAKYVLDKYINKNAKNIRPTLTASETELLSENADPNDPFRVPVFYLLALVDDVISRNDAAAISSSFYVRFDGLKYLPITYTPQSPVPLFTAVTDADEYVEADSSLSLIPIREFYDIQDRYGVILVGAVDHSGQRVGMSSRDGRGVTMVGVADGWGGQTNCPASTEAATSFATPYLASLAFLLESFREAHHLPTTALDTRNRLALSVVVNPSLVGRYLSPGSPDIRRLLTVDPNVVVKRDATIIEGGLGNGANWVEIDSGSTVPNRLGIGHGQGAIQGFQVTSDDRTFIFAQEDLGWKEVKLAALSLWILEDGISKPYTDLNTFKEKYQAVLILD